MTDLKPCPFCGGTPKLDFRMDDRPNSTGHIGHYAIRGSCCPSIGVRTELFFTGLGEPRDVELWEGMCRRVVKDWNTRPTEDNLRAQLAAAEAERDELRAVVKVDGRPIRPQVLWFAQQMERKLRENDHKGGWEYCSPSYLVDRIGQEYTELLVEMQKGGRRAMADEAVDVANFAMMIADNASNTWRKRKKATDAES